MTSESNSPQPRRKRWPRFRLRTFILLITLLAVWFGFEADRAHRQRRAVKLSRRAGGEIWWSLQTVDQTAARGGENWLAAWRRHKNEWIDAWLGDQVDKDVAALDLGGAEIVNRDLRNLQGLNNLQWLSLADCDVSDRGLSSLSSLEKLQWLDLSGASVTAAGVSRLRGLKNLRWLNLDRTAIADSELDALAASWPELKIGRPLDAAPPVAKERQDDVDASTPISAEVQAAWRAYQQSPYERDAFDALMQALGQNPTRSFRGVEISGVYRAARTAGEPLWVIQVYNGRVGVSFTLGCLVLLGPDGRHLKTIDKERIHWSLMAPDMERYKLVQERIKLGEVVDLPDFNGDNAAEIATQRWAPLPSAPSGESTSIYTIEGETIRCVLCVETGNAEAMADIPWASVYLRSPPAEPGELELVTPIFVRPSKQKSTPGYQINFIRDDDQPLRTMARFKWSSMRQSFTGPAEGPQKLWKVHQRDMR